MSHHDHTDQRLADLHTALANDVGALLDLDAGLREALIADHHTRLGTDVEDTLDLDAGLQAIVPTATPIAPDPPSATGTPWEHGTEPDKEFGAVAHLLSTLNTPNRLALRHEPAFDALGTLFVVAGVCARRRRVVDSRTLDLVEALTRALSDTVGLALDNHGRLPGRDLRNAVASARDIATDLDLRLVAAVRPNVDAVLDAPTNNLVRDLDLQFATAFAMARRLVAELTSQLVDRPIDPLLLSSLTDALHRDREAAGPSRSRLVAHRLASSLDRARHDFTTANLRDIDLTQFRLDGLRWSDATVWPSNDWRDQAQRDSTEIAPGLYEIRGGSTHAPAYI